MYTLYLNLLRDMQHDAMVAWSYRQIDETSFMQWQPAAHPQQALPNLAGC